MKEEQEQEGEMQKNWGENIKEYPKDVECQAFSLDLKQTVDQIVRK